MRNRFTDELAICGFNAVAAAAEYNPDKINRLFLREDRLPQFTGLCKQLAERKRPYKICQDDELERICKSVHHQGVVAMILEPELLPLSHEELEAWGAEGKSGLLLHSVGNDHNLGAIIRSAAFFDIPYILLNQDDTEAQLSTAAYRTAEGGMEHVRVRTIQNSIGFLHAASKLLLTIGTDPRARQRIADLPKLAAQEKGPAGMIVVLGNEDKGLPEEIKAACSVLMRIPGTGLMESLNVAQTATIFMQKIYEL